MRGTFLSGLFLSTEVEYSELLSQIGTSFPTIATTSDIPYVDEQHDFTQQQMKEILAVVSIFT